MVICIATMAILLSGCSPLTSKKTTTATTPATTSVTSALQDRIAALESRLAGVESGANASKANIDSLTDRLTVLEGQASGVDNSADIADLQAQIDALTDEVDALDNSSNSDNSTSSISDEIRWRFEQPAFYSKTGVLLTQFEGYLREDTRIREEGLYYIDLWIRNQDIANIITTTQFYITLSLKPSSSTDYALLSSSSTYLDTDDTVSVEGGTPERLPEPSWDADYDTRVREGEDITRKVTFESSIITINTLDMGNAQFSDNYIYMPLVLELYYAD